MFECIVTRLLQSQQGILENTLENKEKNKYKILPSYILLEYPRNLKKDFSSNPTFWCISNLTRHSENKTPKRKLSGGVSVVQCSKECSELYKEETKQPLTKLSRQVLLCWNIYSLLQETSSVPNSLTTNTWLKVSSSGQDSALHPHLKDKWPKCSYFTQW